MRNIQRLFEDEISARLPDQLHPEIKNEAVTRGIQDLIHGTRVQMGSTDEKSSLTQEYVTSHCVDQESEITEFVTAYEQQREKMLLIARDTGIPVSFDGYLLLSKPEVIAERQKMLILFGESIKVLGILYGFPINYQKIISGASKMILSDLQKLTTFFTNLVNIAHRLRELETPDEEISRLLKFYYQSYNANENQNLSKVIEDLKLLRKSVRKPGGDVILFAPRKEVAKPIGQGAPLEEFDEEELEFLLRKLGS